MLTNDVKQSLWHSYPEQPNPDKLVLYVSGEAFDYNMLYLKSIRPCTRFIYIEDIMPDDMVKALHKREKTLEEPYP